LEAEFEVVFEVVLEVGEADLADEEEPAGEAAAAKAL
jgi:hypothetical protein